ncbi:MAG: hypothetical protein V1862_09215, partial [Methanobacteriota archaeon]
MIKYLVPGFLALIILHGTIFPALADTGPVNLTFSSAHEEGGYLTADLILVPSNTNGENIGFISFWFYPVEGDCAKARPLGWQHISLENETEQVSMKAAVPYAVIAGDYTITAIYGTGSLIPAACAKGPAAQTTVIVSTPGQGSHDMAGTLTAGTGNASVPDYRVDSIEGIDTALRVAPGATLQPTVRITNTGADDTTGQP